MSLSGQYQYLCLVEDFTHLRTGEGWLYLATVIGFATQLSWIGAPMTTRAHL